MTKKQSFTLFAVCLIIALLFLSVAFYVENDVDPFSKREEAQNGEELSFDYGEKGYSRYWLNCSLGFGVASCLYLMNGIKIIRNEKKPKNPMFSLEDSIKKESSSAEKKKKKKILNTFYKHLIAIVCILIILLLIALTLHKSAQIYDDPEKESAYSDITLNGETYTLRTDIESVLFIGVDDYMDFDEEGLEIFKPRRSDFLLLVVIDKTNKSYKALQIDRDTMMNIDILGNNAEVLDTVYKQLSYAHFYGEGRLDSCYSTKKVVSELLHGIRIDNFVSMTLDTVKRLNKSLGGIEVKINDDFSKVDPSLILGENVVLTDEQAVAYVTARKDLGNPTNVGRMARHRDYITSAVRKADELYQNGDLTTDELVKDLVPYLVTDMTVDQTARIGDKILEYTFDGFVTIDGENKDNNSINEFYFDEDSVMDRTLELFYKKKKQQSN